MGIEVKTKRCSCGRIQTGGSTTWCSLCLSGPKDARGIPINPQRRDKAEKDGYRAAKKGQTKDDCPFRHVNHACMEQQARRFWLLGWMRGKAEKKATSLGKSS